MECAAAGGIGNPVNGDGDEEEGNEMEKFIVYVKGKLEGC